MSLHAEPLALIIIITSLISTLYHLAVCACRSWTDLSLATAPQQSLSGRAHAEDRCKVSEHPYHYIWACILHARVCYIVVSGSRVVSGSLNHINQGL